MKSNFDSIVSFAQEIERAEQAKADYIATTTKLAAYEAEDGAVRMSLQNGSVMDFGVTQHAQRQVAARLGIPAQYYDKMAIVPGLRSLNINQWFQKAPESRMVRTLDGNVRAFLSNKFRPFDNYTVVKSFLPVIRDMELQVKSQSLTETKMYLQLLFPGLKAEVVGDVHAAGLLITNSEVGAGAVDIKQMIWNLTCTNGSVHGSLFRKHHVGRRIEDSDDDYSIYTDETITADLRAFELKLRDTIKHALSDDQFRATINRYKGAADDKIPVTKVKDTVIDVTKRFQGINESDQKIILENMEQTEHFSRYGLANGITWLAQQVDDRDRSYDLEKIGGELLGMSQNDWNKISGLN